MQSVRQVSQSACLELTSSFLGVSERCRGRRVQASSKTCHLPRGLPSLRAVAEKDRSAERLSRAASNAANSLRQATEAAFGTISSREALQQQTEATAAELRAKAEQLRLQALQASSHLTGIIGRTEEEHAALLKQSSEALGSAARLLRSTSLAASSKLSGVLEDAQKNRSKILEVVRAAPEPIRGIAETAVEAHSEEAAKKGAVIHDFCLGITFGGALVAGGIAWFIVTGSINAIRFGFLIGGILLAAAVGSLKAWRAGQSSNPYIAVQAVTAYTLFARETYRYSQTGHLFPTAIVAVTSLAMVAFYIYVVLAGGNPPPKAKTKAATS